MAVTIGLCLGMELGVGVVTVGWSWRERSMHGSSDSAVVFTTLTTIGRNRASYILNVENGVGVGESAFGGNVAGADVAWVFVSHIRENPKFLT